MTRRVSRRGTVYTEGSHTSRREYPATCSGCGERCYADGRDPLWYETTDRPRTWHVRCYAGFPPESSSTVGSL